MLAVVKEKAEPGVVIKEIPIPKPQEGELLVKVKLASICGTDSIFMIGHHLGQRVISLRQL